MKTIQITHGELIEGDLVWLCGHQFKISNIKTEPAGSDVIRYTGKCTDHPQNESIKNTGYNNARYGAINNAPVTIVEREKTFPVS